MRLHRFRWRLFAVEECLHTVESPDRHVQFLCRGDEFVRRSRPLVCIERLGIGDGRGLVEDPDGRICRSSDFVFEIDDVVRNGVEALLDLDPCILDRSRCVLLRGPGGQPENERSARDDDQQEYPPQGQRTGPSGIGAPDRLADERRDEQFYNLGVRCSVERDVGGLIELLVCVDVPFGTPSHRLGSDDENGARPAHGIECVLGVDRGTTGGLDGENRYREAPSFEPGRGNCIFNGIRVGIRPVFDKKP